jgi:hypothetical protein
VDSRAFQSEGQPTLIAIRDQCTYRSNCNEAQPRDYERAHLFDPIDYYSPETSIFPAIAKSFTATGTLDPMALYLILDWKASRARTKHRARLAGISGSFKAAVKEIASDLHAAAGPEQQLELLMTEWGFRLPTATAILTILYPDIFTIYDIRVCNALDAFHELDRKWSPKLWGDYQRFIDAVRDDAPQGLSLRNCDRWLWGRDKRETLRNELVESG